VLGARGNELIPAPLLEIQTRRPRASWLAQTADRIPQAIQAHAPRLRVRVAVDGAARSRAARYPSLTKENIGLRRAIFGATFFFFPCAAVGPNGPSEWAGQIFIKRAGWRTAVLKVTSDDTVAS